MLSEAAGGEDATRELCAKLASVLGIGSGPAPAAAPAAAQRRSPVVIGGLTAAEVGTGLGKLAKGVIVECSDGAEKARSSAATAWRRAERRAESCSRRARQPCSRAEQSRAAAQPQSRAAAKSCSRRAEPRDAARCPPQKTRT